jgi:hypothetical protein
MFRWISIEVLDHLASPTELKLNRHRVANRLPGHAQRRLDVAQAFAAKEQAEQHQYRSTNHNPFFHHVSALPQCSRK